jgi:hypothetical protein
MAYQRSAERITEQFRHAADDAADTAAHARLPSAGYRPGRADPALDDLDCEFGDRWEIAAISGGYRATPRDTDRQTPIPRYGRTPRRTGRIHPHGGAPAMKTWDVFIHRSAPTPAMLAQLDQLRAALPGYEVTLTSHTGTYRYEAIRRPAAPGPRPMVPDQHRPGRSLARTPRHGHTCPMTAMPRWESAAAHHDGTSGPLLPFDASKPNIARAYDYLLGGKDHFPPDRELAEKILAIYPAAGQMAKENHRFLLRALTYVLAQDIIQYADLGAGLPTSPAVHEIVRRHSRRARTRQPRSFWPFGRAHRVVPWANT